MTSFCQKSVFFCYLNMIRQIFPHWMLYFTLCFFLTGCLPLKDVYHQQSFVFGTLVDISIYGEREEKAREAIERVFQEFDRMQHALHAWQPSTVSRVNEHFAHSNQPIEVSKEMVDLIRLAQAAEKQSTGLFNPAIGHLIQIWGFQSDLPQAKRPASDEISYWVKRQPTVGAIHITEVDNRFFLHTQNQAVKLDFGGIAKGYALDLAGYILKRFNIDNALINIGGNILALGMHGDRPWQVGIQHPRRSEIFATLSLYDGEAIGTSGDYQRYFMIGKQRYCHILDPRTGSPAQTLQAVTVLIPRQERAGVMSDIFSKPLFIQGATLWEKEAKRLHLEYVLAIQQDGSIQMTSAMQQRVQLEK